MGYDFSVKKFVHPVAQAYFDKIAAAGNTVVNKNAVNQFVIGLTEIVHPSLWTAWLMRPQHNAASGTTVYSLGGTQSLNGGLVNSPTWSSDGVQTTAVGGSYIQINNFSISDISVGPSMFCAFTPTGPDPSTSSSSRQLSIGYSDFNTAPLFRWGQSGTGGTNNVLASYFNDDGLYPTGSADYTNHVNSRVIWIYSNSNSIPVVRFNSAAQTIIGGLPLAVQPNPKTSPNALRIGASGTGDGASTLTNLIFFNVSVDVISIRTRLVDLMNATLTPDIPFSR